MKMNKNVGVQNFHEKHWDTKHEMIAFENGI